MSQSASRQKPLEWVGSAKKDLLAFPEAARRNAGYALGLAQLGGKHADAKPWQGEGAGVYEHVQAVDGNAFRAVYTVRFEKAVYVLHCFQKKSPSGIRTAKIDVDLIHERLLRAKHHYEVHYGSQD
jgi:phage-related protein